MKNYSKGEDREKRQDSSRLVFLDPMHFVPTNNIDAGREESWDQASLGQKRFPYLPKSVLG